MNGLGGVTNSQVRDSIGDRCFTAAGLDIDDVNTENVETNAAVVHCCNGIFQTDLAADAELDLSVTTVLNRRGETASIITTPARVAADPAMTKVYILACKGNVSYIIEPEEDTAGNDNNKEELVCPTGYAAYGAIKIAFAAGVVVAFTLGTTALTGVTGQTVTFHDLSVCPANVSDLGTEV